MARGSKRSGRPLERVAGDDVTVAGVAATDPRPGRRPLSPDGHDAETQGFVAVGQVLSGHYRLVRELGRGGMGVVFEAQDLKLEGRRVAVKVLPPELARDEAAVVRLKREAAAVAALEHPGVVRLYEYNDDAGLHYLVMELLDGENLSVYLAHRGRLPLDEALGVARDVAEALDYAHELQLVHRDVKPSNLMWKGEGARRAVKVADFGIAHQLRDSMTRATGQEASGTLLYLAPELLRGKKASPASDQYSLAVTLYELLSGDAPFTGQALSQQILEGEAEPLADVPEAVNAALRRALSKQPEDRFPSCRAFVAALGGAPAPVGARAVRTASLVALMSLLVAGVVVALLPRPLPAPAVAATAPPLASTPGPPATPPASVTAAVPSTAATATIAMASTATPVAVPPPLRTVHLFVESVPEGAEIALDGAPTGVRTNGTVRDVPEGTHVVELTLPRHARLRLEGVAVAAAAGPIVRLPPVRLVPSWGFLRVTGAPADGRVKVEPATAGEGPALPPLIFGGTSPELPAGRYLLTAGARFHRSEPREVIVPDGARTADERFDLARCVATLTLSSTPSGADVALDGKPTGRKTPCELVATPCGEHRVRLVLGAAAWEGAVTLEETGARVDRTLAAPPAAPTAASGTLCFVVEPADAVVTVEGLPVPSDQLRSFKVRPGQHRVAATKSGHRRATETVVVTAGATTNVRFRLESREELLQAERDRVQSRRAAALGAGALRCWYPGCPLVAASVDELTGHFWSAHRGQLRPPQVHQVIGVMRSRPPTGDETLAAYRVLSRLVRMVNTPEVQAELRRLESVNPALR